VPALTLPLSVPKNGGLSVAIDRPPDPGSYDGIADAPEEASGFAPQMPHRARGGREALAKTLGRSTIGRRLAAIVFAHRAAGFDPPPQQPDGARLEKAMRAIRRDKRDDLSAKKRPADGDVLRDMLRTIDGEDLRAYRDRALLAGVGRCAWIAGPRANVED